MKLQSIRFLSFLVFILSIETQAQICNIGQLPNGLRNGLVAYFPFCGNTNDISGNNNIGNANNITFQTDRFGNLNSTASFSKASQSHIAFLGNQNFQQASFTLSAWFNTNTISTGVLGSGNDQFIVGHSPTQWLIGPSYGITLDVVNNADIFSRMWTPATSWQDINAPLGFISANTWYHAVLVYDGVSKIQKFYINGNLIGQRQAELSYFTQAGFFIGGSLQNAAGTIGTLFNGLIDDVGFWSRPLTECEIQQIYTVTNSGFTVNQIAGFNPLLDSISFCGQSATINGPTGFSTYTWNNGNSTQNISVNRSGLYNLIVSNQQGCIGSDSILVSFVDATIIQNDTLICQGAEIQISIDSLRLNTSQCDIGGLPTNLQNGLVAYFPFCGNANDATGRGNNGLVNGPILTEDRFGKPNSAYYFNSNQIIVPHNSSLNLSNSFTFSLWYNPITDFFAQDLLMKGLDPDPAAWWVRHHSILYNPPTLNFSHKSDNQVHQLMTTSPAINQWHHVVGVVNGGEMKIYINGSLQNTLTGFSLSTTVNLSNLIIGTNQYSFTGKIDDVAIWQRSLTDLEVLQLYTTPSVVKWSTGELGNSIRVKPQVSTKYYVTVSNGVTTCMDSILVNVGTVNNFNPLQDTIMQCGTSIKLDAGANYVGYSWNTGETSRIIEPKIGGKYIVTVTDNTGCIDVDTTYLSLVNANILQNDTTLCNGGAITLSVDTAFKEINTFGTILPSNLKKDLVAYYPFNGNANDESGNGNNAVVYNAILATDRLGKINSTYSFSPSNKSSIVASKLDTTMKNTFTYSAWVRPLNQIVIPVQGQNGFEVQGQITNTCVIHPIHGVSYGNESISAGSGLYVGTNGLYVQEHSAGWEAVPINYQGDLSGWHLIHIVYDNKVPSLYIDGKFVKTGVPSSRNIYASLGQDQFPAYTRSGIGAGYPGPEASQFFNGDIDEVMYFKRALFPTEINKIYTGFSSILWSTGDTTSRITVTPSATTKYFVTVSDGITTCTDSILVKVNNLSTFNPLPDTTRLCGVSARLDAGVTFSKYSWSTGETQQIIEPQIGGKYFVTVTDNLNCTASDSTYLSLVNANISQNDTTICNGGSITLSVDTVFKVINTFGTSLPTNLRSDLVAYYPFNGNANDESGNNNHATVYNARLTTDRFGRPNSAYAFSPTDRSSIIPGILNTSMVNSFTYSVWVKPLNSITIPPQGQAANAASGFPNNTCVIHPIHGQNYGPPTLNTGTGVYVGTNGVYLEEHSAGWEAVPISHQMNLTGWHLINIVYENKIPTLYIDGVFIKKGIPSSRQIYASLGPDRYPFLGPTASPSYNRSGIGAGYIPATGTTQYFNGDIDDIFFYRRALSSNEVTQIYNGALNVRWSTGDTTSRITVTPSATTKYFVTVSDGITTCIDSILVKVNNLSSFNPFPDTLSQCGKNINLDAGANFQTYKWSTGSTIRNITVTQGGKYTVDAVTADGCKASDSTIVSLVDVNIDNRDTTICSLSSLNIGLSSSFTHKYRWSTGDITPSIVVNPTETTTYYVNATDDITTCTDSIKVSVELPAKGIRYPTQDIIVNRPTELTARNFGKAYLWTPDLQLNSPRLLNPIITPSKQQQYTVKITTDAGCITIDTVLIRVFPDRNIYVPEGFTPDADGRNDRLYPIPVGIREMRTFRIYNRWGTLLFDNKNANINTGWDGTYLGNAQPMESYVWIAEGIDVDGKFIRRSGNTILIR